MSAIYVDQQKMKKKIIRTTITVAVFLVVVLFIMFVPREFHWLVRTDDVKAIAVVNGNNGAIQQLDEAQTEEVLTWLKSKRYVRHYFRPASAGWSKSVEISNGEKTSSVTFSGKECNINGKWYYYFDK